MHTIKKVILTLGLFCMGAESITEAQLIELLSKPGAPKQVAEQYIVPNATNPISPQAAKAIVRTFQTTGRQFVIVRASLTPYFPELAPGYAPARARTRARLARMGAEAVTEAQLIELLNKPGAPKQVAEQYIVPNATNPISPQAAKAIVRTFQVSGRNFATVKASLTPYFPEIVAPVDVTSFQQEQAIKIQAAARGFLTRKRLAREERARRLASIHASRKIRKDRNLQRKKGAVSRNMLRRAMQKWKTRKDTANLPPSPPLSPVPIPLTNEQIANLPHPPSFLLEDPASSKLRTPPSRQKRKRSRSTYPTPLTNEEIANLPHPHPPLLLTPPSSPTQQERARSRSTSPVAGPSSPVAGPSSNQDQVITAALTQRRHDIKAIISDDSSVSDGDTEETTKDKDLRNKDRARRRAIERAEDKTANDAHAQYNTKVAARIAARIKKKKVRTATQKANPPQTGRAESESESESEAAPGSFLDALLQRKKGLKKDEPHTTSKKSNLFNLFNAVDKASATMGADKVSDGSDSGGGDWSASSGGESE